MKALILNSGLGSRMGVLSNDHPKYMTEISATDTILSRQLKLLKNENIVSTIVSVRESRLVFIRLKASVLSKIPNFWSHSFLGVVFIETVGVFSKSIMPQIIPAPPPEPPE